MAIQIKIKRSTIRKAKRILLFLLAGVLILGLIYLFRGDREEEEVIVEEVECEILPKLMYGIECDKYIVETGEVSGGQTLSHILGKFGVNQVTINSVEKSARPHFNMRNIRAGNSYSVFLDKVDSTALKHFVYESSISDYVVVSFEGDSIAVRKDSKEVTVQRRKATATIESSLWNAMTASSLPVALSCELEDIFGWSVDFFALQKDDKITVIFDERYVDDTRVGIGRVWGAEFQHAGKTYYAIPYKVGGRVSYWDEEGNSQKKQFLKAPLKYSRISSKFSNSRLHPVHKVRRPHHGVDYAAPSGTPVVAIADGVVTSKQWDSKGGGNILKIKHTNNYVSGYLHLKGYAKGIKVGSRITQGELIAYVGSTGTSTGPHLDFRVWKSGKAIDPLKLPSGSVEPIPSAIKNEFVVVRDKILAELKGDVAEEDKVKEL